MHDQLVAQHEAGERAAYFLTNRQIHTQIVAMARNPALEATYAGFAAKILRARSLANYDTGRWQESVDEHEGFMTAFRRRDAEEAGALLADHSRRTAVAVIQALRPAAAQGEKAAAGAEPMDAG